MDLAEAQHRVWQDFGSPELTLKEAIGRLAKRIELCQKAFNDDQWVQAQTELEDSLSQFLLVSRLMGLDLDRAMMRSLARQREAAGHRVFVVFHDRVEIQVAGECRGGWPLFTEEDYRATLQVARELNCDVIHTDARQLDLFRGQPSEPNKADEASSLSMAQGVV